MKKHKNSSGKKAQIRRSVKCWKEGFKNLCRRRNTERDPEASLKQHAPDQQVNPQMRTPVPASTTAQMLHHQPHHGHGQLLLPWQAVCEPGKKRQPALDQPIYLPPSRTAEYTTVEGQQAETGLSTSGRSQHGIYHHQEQHMHSFLPSEIASPTPIHPPGPHHHHHHHTVETDPNAIDRGEEGQWQRQKTSSTVTVRQMSPVAPRASSTDPNLMAQTTKTPTFASPPPSPQQSREEGKKFSIFSGLSSSRPKQEQNYSSPSSLSQSVDSQGQYIPPRKSTAWDRYRPCAENAHYASSSSYSSHSSYYSPAPEPSDWLNRAAAGAHKPGRRCRRLRRDGVDSSSSSSWGQHGWQRGCWQAWEQEQGVALAEGGRRHDYDGDGVLVLDRARQRRGKCRGENVCDRDAGSEADAVALPVSAQTPSAYGAAGCCPSSIVSNRNAPRRTLQVANTEEERGGRGGGSEIMLEIPALLPRAHLPPPPVAPLPAEPAPNPAKAQNQQRTAVGRRVGTAWERMWSAISRASTA